jgi:purine-binding chemotaxis protein CheW
MESYLVFVTEGERFGLPANMIEEVIDSPNIRHLGGMPDHVAGVVFHRGTWLPAIDAAPRLGLPPRSGRATALVIRRGKGRFALTADNVLGIRELGTPDELGVATTDLGLVSPIDPNVLFRSDVALEEEAGYMTAATAMVSIVIFKMNGEEFGTEISNVVEVLEYREPAHVPRAPEFVEGVLQLRDTVLPIIDLRKRMDVPVTPPTPDTRIVVVLIDEERVGLLVDSVVEVAHMPATNVSQPPAFFRGLSAEYLQGLARTGERLIIVLRLERILTSQERIALLRAELSEPTLEDTGDLVAMQHDDRKRGRRSML